MDRFGIDLEEFMSDELEKLESEPLPQLLRAGWFIRNRRFLIFYQKNDVKQTVVDNKQRTLRIYQHRGKKCTYSSK